MNPTTLRILLANAESVRARLEARTIPNHETMVGGVPCREWTGARTPKGYGRLWIATEWPPGAIHDPNDRRRRRHEGRVHRIAWCLDTAEPLSPMDDLHHLCRNRACWAVAHLKLENHTVHAALHNAERWAPTEEIDF